jgi:hypothetical protein
MNYWYCTTSSASAIEFEAHVKQHLQRHWLHISEMQKTLWTNNCWTNSLFIWALYLKSWSMCIKSHRANSFCWCPSLLLLRLRKCESLTWTADIQKHWSWKIWEWKFRMKLSACQIDDSKMQRSRKSQSITVCCCYSDTCQSKNSILESNDLIIEKNSIYSEM